MTSDQIARIIYLAVIACVVGLSLVLQNRRNLPKLAQHGAIWGLIFVGMMAGYGLWADIRTAGNATPRQIDATTLAIPMGSDGHFHVRAKVNGVEIGFLVDTGASDIVLTRADAQRLGYDLGRLAFLGSSATANGTVRTARVRLDRIEVGGFANDGVQALVNDGQLDTSLLGMSYLRLFSNIEIAGNELRLSR